MTKEQDSTLTWLENIYGPKEAMSVSASMRLEVLFPNSPGRIYLIDLDGSYETE